MNVLELFKNQATGTVVNFDSLTNPGGVTLSHIGDGIYRVGGKEKSQKRSRGMVPKIKSLLKKRTFPKSITISISWPINPVEVRFLKNQVIAFDFEHSIVLHQLYPGCYPEWFDHDFAVRKKLETRAINVPHVLHEDVENHTYGVEWVDGFAPESASHMAQVWSDLISHYKDVGIKSIGLQDVQFYLQDSFDEIKQFCGDYFDDELVDSLKVVKSNVERIQSYHYTDLVHGDLNLSENILISRSNGETVFIDWELSRSENVLYDYFYSVWHKLAFEDCLNPVELEKALKIKGLQGCSWGEFLQEIELNQQHIDGYFALSFVRMLHYKCLISKRKRHPDLVNTKDLAHRKKDIANAFRIGLGWLKNC